MEYAAAIGAADAVVREVLAVRTRDDDSPARSEHATHLREHRLDLVVEQVLDHLDEQYDVERAVRELAGRRRDAAKERLAGEARARRLGGLLRYLESTRGNAAREHVREQVAAAAPEVEHALALQPELAVDALRDPTAGVRAEVEVAAAEPFAEEVPRRRDLLRRPDDVVGLGHAANIVTRLSMADVTFTREAPIRNGIRRYVDTVDYADSFGEQWQRYRRVQLDSETRKSLSRDRLFRGTGWTPEELAGELVLEAGCGAGRFTEVLLGAGARVVAVDATTAVDACRETCGDHPRLALVQADLFDL